MRGRGSDDGTGWRLHDGRESIVGLVIGSGTRAASRPAVARSPGTEDPPPGSAVRYGSASTDRACQVVQLDGPVRAFDVGEVDSSERLATEGSHGLPPIPGRRRPVVATVPPSSTDAKLRPSTGCPGTTPARSAIVGARSTLEIESGDVVRRALRARAPRTASGCTPRTGNACPGSGAAPNE